jgi:outer membrane protein
MHKWMLSACALLAFLGLAQTSFTEEISEEAQIKHWSASIGLFQHVGPDYLGSDDYEGATAPHLNLTYQWDSHNYYAFLRTSEGLGIQTRLGQGILGTSIGYRGERDPDENKLLEGLTEVDETPTANIFYRYGHNQYNAGVMISKGLINENRGTLVKIHAGCNCKLKENWHGSLGVFAAWADETYMNDYFGVSALEALATRSTYKASSGILNYGINAGLSYAIDDKQSLSLGGRVYKLGTEAEDSTFVEQEFGGNLSFGYIYNF